MLPMSLFQDERAAERALVRLVGYVELSAAGAIVPANSRTRGFSVAKTGTGLYTVTFAGGMRMMLSCTLQHVYNGTTGNITDVKPSGLATPIYTPGGILTTVVGTFTGPATIADTTATMGIFFDMVMKNGDD